MIPQSILLSWFLRAFVRNLSSLPGLV
uniref:Uncharacterized protein n=1 Tax=Anguilla anguilla TaxID=7936 RepID=A0A0E9VQS0_ANGAN